LINSQSKVETAAVAKSEAARSPMKREKYLQDESSLLLDTRVDTDKGGRKILVNEIRIRPGGY